ncbi:hypothetical protein B0T11DRAFT_298665 [Plectosphaerella cucumerina]|uniref:DUF1772-domain-containing protein n=1 Tax=Plectosphaerella cucumerina TaxID=40658 RepID=A0A8K0THB0_9PEZI|nr:hypothetical protein B0T11DRAFT_298665 [Plectosphaerella cucumerina]
MSLDVDWTKVLHLTSLLINAHLAGFHYCSDAIVLDNLDELKDSDAIVKGWFRSWDVGRRIGPASTMIPTVGYAICAWNAGIGGPSFNWNVVAAFSMLTITSFTVINVFPINDVLLAAHKKVVGAKSSDSALNSASIRRNVAAWKAGDRIRMYLARLAVVAGAMATLAV